MNEKTERDVTKMKFKSEAIEKIKVKEFTLTVYESDPYYHVVVEKNGKVVEDELLANREDELEKLKRKYERM